MKKQINRWVSRWKLRQIIAGLSHRITPGTDDGETAILKFTRMLEATEIMSRGLKRDAEVTMTCTREELDHFIRYVCTLHDSRLSLLIRARIGLATLIVKDEEVLGETPKEALKSEYGRSLKGQKTEVIGLDGKPMRIRT